MNESRQRGKKRRVVLNGRIALIDKNMKEMPKLIEETRKVGSTHFTSFLGGVFIQTPYLP